LVLRNQYRLYRKPVDQQRGALYLELGSSGDRQASFSDLELNLGESSESRAGRSSGIEARLFGGFTPPTISRAQEPPSVQDLWREGANRLLLTGSTSFFSVVVRRADPVLMMPLAAESIVVRLSGCSGVFIESNVSRSFNFLRAVRALWEPPPPERREGFRFSPISTAELGAQAPEQAVAA
jgi:hypothetical protein